MAKDGAPARDFPNYLADGIDYNDFQDFSGVTFSGPVYFRNVRFLAGVSFANAIFRGPVRFVGVTVPQQAGNRANFKGCHFRGPARFNACVFYGANFQGARFLDGADFRRSKFNLAARFEGAEFESSVKFHTAAFNRGGYFAGAKFAGAADFDRVKFGSRYSHARFKGATFASTASFKAAHFSGHADFTDTRFRRGAIFDGAMFSLLAEDELGSSGTDDNGPVEPPSTDLLVSFERAHFYPGETGVLASFIAARFGDTNFHRHVNFDEAQLVLDAAVAPPKAQCKALFSEMRCNGRTSFRDAQFGGGVEADFSETLFLGDLDLHKTGFGRDVVFDRCQFRQALQLTYTRFTDYPSFDSASFNIYPNLSRSQLPDKLTTRAYKLRKEMTRRIGVLRRMAAQSHDKDAELALLVNELRLGGGLASRLYGVISNYGQSWVRPTAWLLAFALIAFPLIHLAISDRLPRTQEEAAALLATGGPDCINGVNGGSALAAALELSVKNALVIAPENETRSKRIVDCLGSGGAPGVRTVATTIAEALQTILSVVLVFFIGAAVRRRLQLR